MRNRLLKIFLGVLLLPVPSLAYVTSAVLEFSCDDYVAIHLNGSVLLERSQFAPWNFDAISTADGTLPLELFRENDTNYLAIENIDTKGVGMEVAYRLTVYHSDGDPVVIWSDPDATKFLHLSKAEKNPPGWTQPSFDDSGWGTATLVSFPGQVKLPDPAFAGIFGGGKVPFIAHKANGKCNGGDHNLFRTTFKFPSNPAKVDLLVQPRVAKAGQKVAVRLVPGPDTTELSRFNLLAWLPENLEVVGTSAGSAWDRKLRRLHWSYSKRDMRVGYARLHASKVVNASGWTSPEKFLGPEKPGKERDAMNVNGAVFSFGASPNFGREGWFDMDDPDPQVVKDRPVIQGVMFHSQLKSGGIDGDTGEQETDKIFFNYSVDGTNKGVLKSDVNVNRMAYDWYWIDGYHHASEDRDWTWQDLKNLRVMFKGLQVGKRDRNLLASVTCVVRYYYPGKAAPWFYAKVLEKGCEDIKLEAGVFRPGTQLVSSDPYTIRANPDLCPPPTPPRMEPPPPPIVQAKPQPTSTPETGGMVAGVEKIGLGCLTMSPNRVDFGGTFISFCLATEANVTVNIYDGNTGQGRRRIEARSYRAAQQHQVFFNAQDDKGGLLNPGEYICELSAQREGRVEVRHTSFSIVKKRSLR